MSSEKVPRTNTAPSAGTKVDLGANAPVKEEGPGWVPPDSLAAESARSGGQFAQNPGVEPGSGPSQQQEQQQQQQQQQRSTESDPGEGGSNSGPSQQQQQRRRRRRSTDKVSPHQEGGSKSGTYDDPLRHQYSYSGPAPTYVASQYVKYKGPPKGKDIHEVRDFEGEYQDGLEVANSAEPGSELDPGRAAEKRFGIVGRGEEGRKHGGERGQRRFGHLDETSA